MVRPRPFRRQPPYCRTMLTKYRFAKLSFDKSRQQSNEVFVRISNGYGDIRPPIHFTVI